MLETLAPVKDHSVTTQRFFHFVYVLGLRKKQIVSLACETRQLVVKPTIFFVCLIENYLSFIPLVVEEITRLYRSLGIEDNKLKILLRGTVLTLLMQQRIEINELSQCNETHKQQTF